LKTIRFSSLLKDVRAAFAVAAVLHIAVVFAWRGYRHPSGLEDLHVAGFMYEGRGFVAYGKSEAPHYSEEARAEARQRAMEGPSAPYSEFHPTSKISPGYPYFLYAVWKLAGRNTGSFLAIAVLQALLVSSVVFPLRSLTTRWFGERAGICAMWIACCMPFYAYYPTQYSPMAVYIALHPWLASAWVALAAARPSRLRSVLTGAATGAAGLFQPLVLGVFGIVGLGLLLRAAWNRDGKRTVALLIVPLVVAAVLVPWTARNYAVHGRLILVRYSAMPFWIGNNPHATGTEDAGGGNSMYVTYPPKCVSLGAELTEAEYQDALYREAWDYIRADPPAFAGRTLKKFAWYWTMAPLKYKLGDGISSSPAFRCLHAAYWLGFVGLALALCLLGTRFPRGYLLVLGAYFVVCSGAYSLLHIANSRMRTEIEFILIPAVAQAIVLLWPSLRRLGLRVVLLTAATGVLLLLSEYLVRAVRPQRLEVVRPDIWEPTEGLGWRIRPNLDTSVNTGEREVRIYTDERGFRKGLGPRPQGRKRVLLVGDSFVEALSVPYEENMGGLIESRLSKRPFGPVEVWNAGVGGYNPCHYLILAKSVLAEHSVDLVVVALYVDNDAVEEWCESFPMRESATARWISPVRRAYGFLCSHSHLYALARRTGAETFRHAQGHRKPLAPMCLKSEAGSRRWSVTADICKAIRDTAAAHGAAALFVLIPAEWQVDRAPFQDLLRRQGVDTDGYDLDQPNRLLKTALVAKGLDAVDLLPAFRAAFAAGSRLYGKVDDHFSPRGHAVAVEALEPALLRSLTDPSETRPPNAARIRHSPEIMPRIAGSTTMQRRTS
jgi:hypothetical protein